MKINNYDIQVLDGVKIKTDFKTIEEERDWLFKKHFSFQILYDRKFKSTGKWRSRSAAKLRLLISIMRIREIDLKDYNHNKNTRKFFEDYRKELEERVKRDYKKLTSQIADSGKLGGKDGNR